MFRKCEYGHFGVGLLYGSKLIAYIDADEICYITEYTEKWQLPKIAEFANWYGVSMQYE